MLNAQKSGAGGFKAAILLSAARVSRFGTQLLFAEEASENGKTLLAE